MNQAVFENRKEANPIKVLFIYPNTFGMNMLPPAIALFNALLKREGHSVRLFDATYYSVDYGIDSDGSKADNLNVMPYDPNEKGIRMKPSSWVDDLRKEFDDFDPDLIAMSTTEDMWNLGAVLLESLRSPIQRKKAAAPEALTGDATDQALAGLKSPQWYKVKAACDQLAKAAPVEERRAEVAEALEGLLSHENGFVRPAAATALGVWGTEDSVSALVAALEEGDVLLKNAAVEALAKFDDQGAVEVVAEQVAVAALRFRAARALKAAGPRTEPAVLSLLGHSDRAVRMEACRILGAIGTDKSLESLRALLTDPNRSVAMNAKRAVQAIERRK